MALNHIVLMGRLTRDPELRRTQNGISVTSFTLAVDRDFSGRDGGQKETDFIDCIAWRNTAEAVSNYLAKGRQAVVSGRLQVRTWKDKDGSTRKATEVVAENVYFAGSKPDAAGNGSYGASPYNNAYNGPAPATGGYMAPATGGYTSPVSAAYSYLEDEDDGELPF